MAKDSGFGAAFAAARKKLGAGKTFTYNGKSYSTNRADDKPAAKAAPAPASTAFKPTPMPTPKPAMKTAPSVADATARGQANAAALRARTAGMENTKPKPRPASMKPAAKPASSGGSMPSVDAMGNAYRKGGMVSKPKTMASAMKKYEGSAADMKADKAGAKKMMGKGLPPFMKKGK